MLEIEDPTRFGIFKFYLKLVNAWLDKIENMVGVEESNMYIDIIIADMHAYLKEHEDEKFMLKYFFINGEGWKNYNPFDIIATGKFKNTIIALRTGTDRFLNPDLDILSLGITEGPADEVLQEIINKTREFSNVTPEELAQDYANIEEMERNLRMMEENLEREKQNQSEEERIMEELFQNDEVRRIYKNLKEGKMENKNGHEEVVEELEEQVEPTPEEVIEDATKEAEEELKEEAEKVEKDIKEPKKLSLTAKVAIGVVVTSILVGAGYLLKNKFLNK